MRRSIFSSSIEKWWKDRYGMSSNGYMYKSLSLWYGEMLTYAAVQDCRDSRDAASNHLWVSERDNKLCCGLQWETSSLLAWHCLLSEPVLLNRGLVTRRRAHHSFHVAKPFLIPSPFPCNKHTARGIRRDWGILQHFNLVLKSTTKACY